MSQVIAIPPAALREALSLRGTTCALGHATPIREVSVFGRHVSLAFSVLALTFAGRLNAQVILQSEPGPGYSAANGPGPTVTWYFQNTGSTDQTLYLSCATAGRVTSCSVPGSITLPAYNVNVAQVTTTSGPPGIGRVTLTANCGSCSFYYSGGPNLTVQGQTQPTSSSISIDPTPHNGDYRDATKCVADCFDATVSYTTPAYFSMDTPRSVTLLYRSSQARPMGFVQIDATDNTGPAPDVMSIRLKRPDGTWVTFTNGSQELFYADSALGTSRLAAQFDASGLATGDSNYTVVAHSWRSGVFQEATYPIRVFILNEQTSPFGAGWSIPGFQRLFPLSDASVAITEGDGSIAFFKIDLCPSSPSSCTFINPPGDFTTVSTNGVWPIAGYTRAYPDGTVIFFNASGLVTSVRDRFGRLQTSYGYNASNLLVAITDSTGKADSLAYDANNKLRSIRDPGGRVDSITVDASGNLTRIKDAVGGLPFQGTYDANHRLIGRTDRRGGAWGVAYDFAGKAAADTAPQITANGQPLRPVVGYGSFEKAVLIDPASGRGTSTNNPALRIIGTTIRVSVTNPRRITTTYAPDRFGAATRIEEPLGRTTSFLRDGDSHVVRDSLPEGLLTANPARGHIHRYIWSGPTGRLKANLAQVWDSATQRTINYTYDNTYNLLTLMSGDVDSLINVLTSDKKATDSSRIGGATVWQRSTHVPPFCTQSDQPTAHAVTCSYLHSDGFQNTDSVVSYGQPTTPRAKTVYQYDGHGQRIRTVNAVGDTTWIQYDSLGRVKSIIGPLHDITSYSHDSLYLTQVQDARGQTYQLWPNALGWPDSTADPAGRMTGFTYDSGGNVRTVVNRRAQTIGFTYDSLDHVRSRVVATDTARYFTDPLGRYVTAANRESVDTLKADSAGRALVEITCRVLVSGAAAQCFRDSSVYELRDLRTKLMVSAPGLWSSPATLTAAYHYNGNMLLDSITNFVGEKQTFTYGGELRDSTRTFLALNNLTLTYGHPPWVGGTSALTLSDANYNSLLGSAYAYDTLSRVTTHYHGTLATPDTVRFLADSAGRLVRAADTSYTWSSAACSLGILGQSCDYTRVLSKSAVGMPATFYYDSVGNRKDSPTQGYGADPGNRLRRLGYVRMDYDLDGSLTRKRILNPSDTTRVVRTDSLFWSATGQLDSLHNADSLGNPRLRISWGYDAFGRQVRQSVRGLSPQSNDFATGNVINAVGGTVQVTLNPGNAYDNTYAVNYSVSVTIYGSSSTYGTATLVVAIETNDGGGWVQRATPTYRCGYLSGPPPYPDTNCPWNHEPQSITVTGLGPNTNIRLRAASFSTDNGAGGSFAVRGGDGTAYHGVTYTSNILASTTRFLWDGDNLSFKLDTLGRWVAFWTFYPGTQEPQSVTTTDCSSGTCTPFDNFYYVTDALHNTVALIRSNPNQVYNQFRYGPLGDSLAVTGPTANTGSLRYKGAFYDGYTRYYRMGARYYDSDVGRFISEDPLGLGAGINPYTFAGNDYVNGYDPGGTCFIACWIIGAIIDIVVTTVVNDIVSSSPSRLAAFSPLGICSGGPEQPPDPIPIPKPPTRPVALNVCGAAAAVGGTIALYEVIKALSQSHGQGPCGRGFSETDCAKLRETAKRLAEHGKNSLCKTLGSNALRRIAAGRYIYLGEGLGETGFEGWAFDIERVASGELPAALGRVGITASGMSAPLITSTIAHEEYHYYRPNASHAKVYRVGFNCAG